MTPFLIKYSVIASLLWILVYRTVIKALDAIPFFDALSPPEPEKYPKLSVIVAACNEEETIEEAMNKLLHQSYPDLEVIVVNDRSTDATGEILSTLAGKHWALRVINIDHLPSGWLGKVHALHKGTALAAGEWLLYTDADVHFEPDALRKAMAHALSEEVDHFAIAPGLQTSSFLLNVIINAFAGMFMLFTGAGRKSREKSKRAVGIGAFNLVRKEAFQKTEGFEWLKMEVADDVGLALMLKERGAKSTFALSQQDINIIWYKRVRDMFVGLEKNIFGTTTQYSYLRMIILLILTWAYIFAPFVAMAAISETALGCFGLIAYFMLTMAAYRKKAKFGGSIITDLFIPLGHFIISLMLLRSGILCLIRGGILWRGTLYSTAELRKGQRVRL